MAGETSFRDPGPRHESVRRRDESRAFVLACLDIAQHGLSRRRPTPTFVAGFNPLPTTSDEVRAAGADEFVGDVFDDDARLVAVQLPGRAECSLDGALDGQIQAASPSTTIGFLPLISHWHLIPRKAAAP